MHVLCSIFKLSPNKIPIQSYIYSALLHCLILRVSYTKSYKLLSKIWGEGCLKGVLPHNSEKDKSDLNEGGKDCFFM